MLYPYHGISGYTSLQHRLSDTHQVATQALGLPTVHFAAHRTQPRLSQHQQAVIHKIYSYGNTLSSSNDIATSEIQTLRKVIIAITRNIDGTANLSKARPGTSKARHHSLQELIALTNDRKLSQAPLMGSSTVCVASEVLARTQNPTYNAILVDQDIFLKPFYPNAKLVLQQRSSSMKTAIITISDKLRELL
jgi:hypothetical protein